MPLTLHAQPRPDSKSWDFELGVPGFHYSDLHRIEKLQELDAAFRQALREAEPELSARFEGYRAESGAVLSPTEESDLLTETAPHLGRFIAQLFHVEAESEHLTVQPLEEAKLFEWKKKFLNSRVLKTPPTAERLAELDPAALERDYLRLVDSTGAASLADDPETALAKTGLALLPRSVKDKDPSATEGLDLLERWCQALAYLPELRGRAAAWPTLRRHHALQYESLVHIHTTPDGAVEGPPELMRERDGFRLTDERMNRREVLGEAHYCLYCHDRGKDSCSKGFTTEGKSVRHPDGKAEPQSYRKNPLGISLQGCPLDERISEFQMVKRDGHSIGALAIIIIDNPLCPGTGHRICNDCMKACVFQKQQPVDIPQIETSALTDVLGLPYGVEIYGLLTRWNPLNARRPYPRPYNGKNVLVVGMGPAGYTLAHHLLQEGFGVVGIDGLKIEPLAPELIGSERRAPRPIRDWGELKSRLDQRVLLGFGGVSEYGITVRWDKNFLDLIYLTLARRRKFKIYGGTRFGGTITLEEAFGELDFDHIAIAAGAGRPTIVPMKNNLIRGVRKASDFLMALQLSGASKHNGLANLQVQLPAVVIGGGLTGIDTATELAAYYVVQVEKTLARVESLAQALGGEAAVYAKMTKAEADVTREFVEHGRLVRREREAAAYEERLPRLSELVRQWGGVTLAYRKRLQDSPAYRLNHEEIQKALEEGIRIADCLAPLEILDDGAGAARGVVFERQAEVGGGDWRGTGERLTLEARAVLVAAGTQPNSIYEREYPGTFQLDARKEFFQAHRATPDPEAPGRFVLTPVNPRKGEVGFFTSYQAGGRLVSFYGDNHPIFAGNVVKAMASAKRGARAVAALFEGEPMPPSDAYPIREERWIRLSEKLDEGLRAKVLDVVRLTSTIVEVIVRAPMAARRFEPGQFYRLQNYESSAPIVDGVRLTMEGLALTGAWVDKERGVLSMIVLEMGHSSRLCAMLEPGEEVVVMGPTGTPTEIPEGETVLLAGGGLGNAVLFSIAEALRAKGNRVLYFAGYRQPTDLFKRTQIERSTDLVVWACDQGPAIPAHRPQDKSFVGNIVQAMDAYARGELGEPTIPLREVTRIIAIGSDRMMNAVRVARKNNLACHLSPEHTAIGSINSPMQCMLKEVCAQCLQKHVDPQGKESEVVFSCFNQDQELDKVDFTHLQQRLAQNQAAEKLTNLWMDHLLERLGSARQAP